MASIDHLQVRQRRDAATSTLDAPPSSHRRVARRVRASTPPWVLLHVMHDALDPSWTPDRSADRLLEELADPRLLQIARARVHVAGGERPSLFLMRALATLDVAIGRLEHLGGATESAPATIASGAATGHGTGERQ